MAFVDWDQLLYGLHRGECILFLGPEVTADLDGEAPRPPSHLLAERLLTKLEAKGHALPDGSSHELARLSQIFFAREGELALEMEVASWHTELRGRLSKLHNDLAALPFQYIVTSGCDPLLEEALRTSAGKQPYVERYHYRGENKELLPEPSERSPILFHLYGYVAEPASLVLTEIQLLDFLASLIAKDPSLPNDLRSILRQGRLFLFLGFGFGQWYLRILLHVLKCIKQGDRAFAVEGLPLNGGRIGSDTILFYRENLGLEIYRQPLAEFVSELRARFASFGFTVPSAQGFPEETRKATVFICHANEDKEIALRINEALEKANLNPWIDAKKLRGGDRWDPLIESTIAEGIDYFVVVNSTALARKSQDKFYVNKEINTALSVDKQFLGRRFIIPVCIDDAPLLKPLAPFQALDLRDERDVLELVRSIKREER